MKVMIAGGGTGGHVYPGIAIYQALQRLAGDVEVLFVGAKSGVETTILRDLGLEHVLLPGRGVRGTGLIAKAASPFFVFMGVLRGVRHMARFKPDVVIGTGGYASFATVAAAILTGRRRVLQEQNSVPGLANRLLSRFADLVLLSYEGSRMYLGGKARCAVVGNPLRVDTTRSRSDAAAFLGLDPSMQTVLFFGGSRGAHSVNVVAQDVVRDMLTERRVQFVLLTGSGDYEAISGRLRDLGSAVKVYPFLEEIWAAYAMADVAVARAGASAVFELAAFAVPTIFVPYPHAADDHQRLNAEPLSAKGAAIMVDDSDLDSESLKAMITSLLDDKERREEMSRSMRDWGRTDAGDLAAREIFHLLGTHRMDCVIACEG